MQKEIKIPVYDEVNVSFAESGLIPDAPVSKYVLFINRHHETNSYHYWDAVTPAGRRYSVVDVKSLFASHPMSSMRDYFNYWEAMPLDSKGELLDVVIRASSMKNLADELYKRD